MSSFRLIKRNEIDEKKWNALINQSQFSLPYALTWYLDAVAENWGALVYQDYVAVMPMVWLRKLGIKCLYQPYFCQQLGIFSKEELTPELASGFVEFATQQFRYIHINLNSSAAHTAGKFSMVARKNLLLNLNRGYSVLSKSYTENHKRNVAKADKSGLIFTEGVELKNFQKFYLGNVNPEKENFKPKHAKIFKSLTAALIAKQTGKIFAATGDEGNLVAAVLMIFHHSRIIGIINTSSAEGKKRGAAHFLFDRLIQKFSGQNLVLDFEGSSIPGIARFYEGFGAQPEIFYNYQHSVIKNAISWFKQ